MNLKHHQKYLLNKLHQHDKNIIFWQPGMGVSCILDYFILQYTQKNKNKKIFILSYTRAQSKYRMRQFFRDVDLFSNKNYFTNIKKDKIELVNNNIVNFYLMDQSFEYFLYGTKPDIIIVDDIRFSFNSKKMNIIDIFTHNCNCKVIFTSNKLDLDLIKFFDFNNDFYINIMPYNFNGVFVNDTYYNDTLKKLSYKPKHLLDFYNTRFEREEKLKRLKKLSDGI